jgi:hypothetical protein
VIGISFLIILSSSSPENLMHKSRTLGMCMIWKDMAVFLHLDDFSKSDFKHNSLMDSRSGQSLWDAMPWPSVYTEAGKEPVACLIFYLNLITLWRYCARSHEYRRKTVINIILQCDSKEKNVLTLISSCEHYLLNYKE